MGQIGPGLGFFGSDFFRIFFGSDRMGFFDSDFLCISRLSRKGRLNEARELLSGMKIKGYFRIGTCIIF